MLKIFRLSLENSWKSMHLFSKIKHLQVLRLHFFSALVRTYPHNWSFPGNVFHIKELLNTLMGSLFSPSPRIDHSIGLPPLYLCRIFILFLIALYQQKRVLSSEPENPSLSEESLITEDTVSETVSEAALSDASIDAASTEEVPTEVTPTEETAIQDATIQARKITHAEISTLPRRFWPLANNSFLLHGCHNYHHLLLIKEKDHLWLGVPGLYDPREAHMANLFGFPQFTSSYISILGLTEDECENSESFGHWCRYLM